MFSWYSNLEAENKIWVTCLALLLAGIAAGYSRGGILIILLLAVEAGLIVQLILLVVKLKKKIHQTLISERITKEKLEQQVALSELQQEKLELADRELFSLRWELGRSQKEAARSEKAQATKMTAPHKVEKTGTARNKRGGVSQSHPPGDHSYPEIPDPLHDDRNRLQTGDRCVLIVEEELEFARLIMEMVRARNFGGLVACDGRNGILLAERFQPRAILLDMFLSNIDDWEFMLNLRLNPSTSHILVHFLTCPRSLRQAIAMGATGFLTSPLTLEQVKEILTSVELAIAKPVKKLLAIGKTPLEKMEDFFAKKEISLDRSETGAEALYLLSKNQFDCVLADLGLPDISGFDLLEHIQAIDESRRTPVILCSDRVSLTVELEKVGKFAARNQSLAKENPELLAKEVLFFLHLLEDDLPLVKKNLARAATP